MREYLKLMSCGLGIVPTDYDLIWENYVGDRIVVE